MSPSPGRRFTLFDAMVLVAALALGFAQGRTYHYVAPPSPTYYQPTNLERIHRWTDQAYDRLFMPGYPSLVALTMAVLVQHLRAPRRSLRRLARLPGFLACALPCLMILPNVMQTALYFSVNQRAGPYARPGSIADIIWTIFLGENMAPSWGAFVSGFAVGAVWLSLLCAGRWRAEPDWVDRLGRVLGVAWIAVAAGCWCYSTISYLDIG